MLDRTQPVEFVRHVQHMLNAAQARQITDTDAVRLCEFAVPLCEDSFTNARWRADEKVVAFKVNHHPALRSDRTINLMDFACVLLMCLAGGRLVNVPAYFAKMGRRFRQLKDSGFAKSRTACRWRFPVA